MTRLSRRTLLRLGGAALLAPACATPTRVVRPIADSPRAALFNRALTVTPGPATLSLPVEGALPEGLLGARAVWNGPAMLKLGGRLAHPFDGHGFVRSFAFREDGTVAFQSRYVDTTAFRAERDAGRLIYKGIGTLPSDPHEAGGAAKNREAPGFKNVANTTLTPWGGALLAGWEGGPPHALDPETLETKGLERLGNVLRETEAFLAHTRLDRERNVLVGLTPEPGRTTTLKFREFNQQLGLLSEVEVELPAPSFAHDFVITRNYYVLALNPLDLSLWTYLFSVNRGEATLFDMLSTDVARASAVVLVPRPNAAYRGRKKETAVLVQTPAPLFAVHYGQAYDDGANVVLDVCAFRDFPFGVEFGFTGATTPLDPALPDERSPQRLYRLTLNPATKSATARQLSDYGIDFPRVHPDYDGRAAPRLYGATRKDPAHSDPFDSVLALDAVDLERPESLWSAGEDQFVSEPLFVPTPGGKPHEGHLVVCVSDPARDVTHLVVLDAEDVSRGPVASARLPLQPYPFHGVVLPKAV